MKKPSRFKHLNSLSSIIILTLLSGSIPAAQISGLEPGSYDNAIIGFDSSNRIVTGYFSENSADDSRPLMRCEFYFSGQLTGSTAKLKIYQLTLPDKPTAGSLNVSKNGKSSSINLQLEEEQPGCINIYPKAELAKTKLAIVLPAKWIEIRMAAERMVYFHKGASPETKTRKYIAKGDVVGVVEYKGDWGNVVYIGETKSTSGWIKLSQLFASVKFPEKQP